VTIRPLHCLPVRDGTRVRHCARGEALGGAKVTVTFRVRGPLGAANRTMSVSFVGTPECRVGVFQ
jgi:hypothetical protein